jgi:cardiolipin synthase A/B
MRYAPAAALLLLLALAGTTQGQDTALQPAVPNLTVPAFDPARPLAGSFRFKGTDRDGPYSGTLTFTPTPNGSHTYQRRYDPSVMHSSRRPRVDNGRATLVGHHLHLEQVTASGLAKAFAVQATSPKRHAFYRLHSSWKKGRGFTFVSHFERGTEQLIRLGPDMDNNHVQLLIDGQEFFPLLAAELEAAKRSINMQFYIFADDALGSQVGQLLARKAREGVPVKLLCDDFDSWISDELMAHMRGAGVEVIIQNGRQQGVRNTLRNFGRSLLSLGGLFGRPSPKPSRGVFNHDHRKIVTIDGRVGFAGGMNIAQHYVSAWHDIHARVEGNVVRDMEASFYGAWSEAGGELGQLPAPDPIVNSGTWWPGSMSVDLVEQIPGVRLDIKKRYLSEIHAARRTIHIENAFFLHQGVIDALKKRAHEGVDVVVIIPTDEHNNSRVVQEAFNWVQNDVVRSGIKLYKYRDRMTHGKVAVFDGLTSTVGSCNLDDLALEKLYEANLFIDNDPEFARIVEERVFRTDVSKSDRVRIKRDGLGARIKSGLLHFFRGFL